MASHHEYIGKVVTLKEEFDELDECLEAGMMARIVSIQKKDDDVFQAELDASEFEERNRPFESANYYDAEGRPTLTAREKGVFSNKIKTYLPDPKNWDAYFDLTAGSEQQALLQKVYREQAEEGLGYVPWLERELLRVMLEREVARSAEVDQVRKTTNAGSIDPAARI